MDIAFRTVCSVVAAVVRVRLGGAVEVGRGAGDLLKYADSRGILQVGVAENLVVAGVDGVKRGHTACRRGLEREATSAALTGMAAAAPC
jgi:hypothetical protein